MSWKSTDPADPAEVGKPDKMSKLAYRLGLPICGKRGCTRAAGHDEALPTHAGSQHVLTSNRHIVLEVF